MAQIEKAYPEDFRYVFRHYPLIGTPEQPFHDKAALSAQAAEAAGLQGKFWEMHDVLFERQSEWASLSVAEFEGWLAERAGEIKLNVGKFKEDLTSQALVDKAQAAWNSGNKIGLPGTPFLLINGEPWPQNLPMSYQYISAIIELELLKGRQFNACPPMVIDPLKKYTATIQTEKGDIVVALFADKAPLAVNNFVFLARNGWYDNVVFHRVIAGFVAQAGDPTGTGFGGPGYAFVNETSPDLTFDRAGLLAMANAGGAQTNGSQFFITFAPAANLNGGFTIFGEVIEGMDVAESLTVRDPDQGEDLPPGDKIVTIVIEEK
jgi:cyclophilin family peptidyl-prolyl cis-trans isomerase